MGIRQENRSRQYQKAEISTTKDEFLQIVNTGVKSRMSAQSLLPRTNGKYCATYFPRSYTVVLYTLHLYYSTKEQRILRLERHMKRQYPGVSSALTMLLCLKVFIMTECPTLGFHPNTTQRMLQQHIYLNITGVTQGLGGTDDF